MITASADTLQIRRNLEAIIKATGPVERRQILVESSDPIIEAMKSRVPVDTGLLRDSIGVDPRRGVKRGDAYVGVLYKRRTKNGKKVNPRIYGRIVEFGSRFMRATPFLRPGYAATKDRVISIIAGKFDRLIKSKIS